MLVNKYFDVFRLFCEILDIHDSLEGRRLVKSTFFEAGSESKAIAKQKMQKNHASILKLVRQIAETEGPLYASLLANILYVSSSHADFFQYLPSTFSLKTACLSNG